jgi:hypothetical protein
VTEAIVATLGAPEERELEAKLGELAALQTELVQRELELATLLGKLHSFEQKYLTIVGVRYAQLDQIEAEIAEARARSDPGDDAAKHRAGEARDRAKESEAATGSALKSESQGKFDPQEGTKRLYREIAKRVHPDQLRTP